MTGLCVLIVDDHAVVRTGLRMLLESEGGFTVVAEAENGEAAVNLVNIHHPDVVMMDIQMPGTLSGIEACEKIVAASPDVKVIMLTSYSEDEIVREAIRAGAAGYLLKRNSGRQLVEDIRHIADGDAVVDTSVTNALLDAVRYATEIKDASAFHRLTPQEIRILALLVEGMTNHEIACKLYIGEGTVRNYVGNILSKLLVSNRAEAAVFAVRHHIERHLPLVSV